MNTLSFDYYGRTIEADYKIYVDGIIEAEIGKTRLVYKGREREIEVSDDVASDMEVEAVKEYMETR